jgi:peptide/nickel transport system substrate-binding protein
MQRIARRRAWRVGLAWILVLAVGACGGGQNDQAPNGAGDSGVEPVAGGKVTYGLEAETSGGFCLPEAQLGVSGMMVVRAFYDTLTVPDDHGDYRPYLARSVVPNSDFTEWTITLREGVKFHDGSDLDATVVKNNLAAFRGVYPGRQPLLSRFVFSNIPDVTTVDPLTVRVTTSRPWVAFPAYLFNAGRLGIMAQAQLDDPTNCDKQLVGTGPFVFEEWVPNDHLTGIRNPDYWQRDVDGNQLPYLDEIEFRPIPETSQRINALQTGQINAMLAAAEIQRLRDLRDQGRINLVDSEEFTDLGYFMFNTGEAPFEHQSARAAFVHAFDRDRYNEILYGGVLTNATGPFAPGNAGYLDDTGYPSFDLAAAERDADRYRQDTGETLTFTLSTVNDATALASAQLIQQMMRDAGIEVSLVQTDQSQLVNQAMSGDFQVMQFRNHPGGDPDTQYIWWHSGSPVNFGRIADPDVDRLLDDARSNPDPAARERDYQDLNRVFADRLYNAWSQYRLWNVGTATNVHGVYGPDLPDGAGPPWPGLATGHPVLGLFVTP